jgi:hypothetical protein
MVIRVASVVMKLVVVVVVELVAWVDQQQVIMAQLLVQMEVPDIHGL